MLEMRPTPPYYPNDSRPWFEQPEGSGLVYVQIQTFGPEQPPEVGVSAYLRAAAWSKVNFVNFVGAEVDAGLAYVSLDHNDAAHHNFLHDGRAMAYAKLEKTFGTKYGWLSKLVTLPNGNYVRPTGIFEPEHTELPMFEPIAQKVYHEEVPKNDFLDLIAEALPLNENFDELSTLLASRWKAHPMLRHLAGT